MLTSLHWVVVPWHVCFNTHDIWLPERDVFKPKRPFCFICHKNEHRISHFKAGFTDFATYLWKRVLFSTCSMCNFRCVMNKWYSRYDVHTGTCSSLVWKKIVLLLNFLFKRCPLKKGKINKKCYYFPFGLNIYVFKINLIALACLVHNYACFVYKIQYKRNIRGLKK